MTWIIGHPRACGVGIAIVATGLGAFVGGSIVAAWFGFVENRDQIVGA